MGLLLLRVVVGLAVVHAAVFEITEVLDATTLGGPVLLSQFVVAAALLAGGILLVVGLFTPIVGALLAVMELGLLGQSYLWSGRGVELHTGMLATLLTATIAAALALIGPGAFSVDARLFGWHEIDIKPSSERSPYGF